MEPTKIVENLYLGNIQNGIHHSNYGFDKIINLTRFNHQLWHTNCLDKYR